MSRYDAYDDDDEVDIRIRRGIAEPIIERRTYDEPRFSIPAPERVSSDHIRDRARRVSPTSGRPRVLLRSRSNRYNDRDIEMRAQAERRLEAERRAAARYVEDLELERQRTSISPISINARRDDHNHEPTEEIATEWNSRLERDRHQETKTDHTRELFQTIYDARVARDVTIHFNLPISRDFENETENFSRLWRLGNFSDARDYFEQELKSHLDHPVIFVQYAEVLLEMGDYKAFELLKPPKIVKDWQVLKDKLDLDTRLHSAKRKSWKEPYLSWSEFDDPGGPTMHGGRANPRRRVSSPPSKQPKSGKLRKESPSYDESSYLHMIWNLLNTAFDARRSNIVNKALDEATFVLDSLVISSEFSSTEVCLPFRW